MVFGERLERVDCHFERHVMNAVLLSKVDCYFLALDLADYTNAP